MVATSLDTDELNQAIDSLEPLPQSTTRLASLLLDDDSNLDEIVRVCCLDQALTARLLLMANSAASASHWTIVNPKAAALRLGRGTILSLATASAVPTPGHAAADLGVENLVLRLILALSRQLHGFRIQEPTRHELADIVK